MSTRTNWIGRAICVAAVCMSLVSVASALDMETVFVGNVGNTADPTSGWGQFRFGAVSYEYRIGKYEVTAGQYAEFLNAVAGVDTYALYNAAYMPRTDYGSGIMRSGGGTIEDPYVYSVASDFVNRPVNYVSYGDAMRFANWLHNGQPSGAQDLTTTEDGAYYLNGATNEIALLAVTREAAAEWAVTSEDEWYKAAYHKNNGDTGDYFDYPTGSDTAPGQDMADLDGNNANYYTAPFIYPIDSGRYTTLVGEFQNSESPYGTFDQGGNVMEWIDAAFIGAEALRGGAFRQPPPDDTPSAWDRLNTTHPGLEASYTGFRVVSLEVPEPGTLTLLSLSSLLLLKRRRSRS